MESTVPKPTDAMDLEEANHDDSVRNGSESADGQSKKTRRRAPKKTVEELQAEVAAMGPRPKRAIKKKKFGEKEEPSGGGGVNSEEEVVSVEEASVSSLPQRKDASIVNHDNCDACNDGGSLLCCDSCPRSFHLECLDPPRKAEDLPDQDWFCNICLASMGKTKPAVKANIKELQSIFDEAQTRNPTTFAIPEALKKLNPPEMSKISDSHRGDMASIVKNPENATLRYTAMPGEGTRGVKRNEMRCEKCKTTESEDMITCSEPNCAVSYHKYCLTPPLAEKPATWLCQFHKDYVPATSASSGNGPALSSSRGGMRLSQGFKEDEEDFRPLKLQKETGDLFSEFSSRSRSAAATPVPLQPSAPAPAPTLSTTLRPVSAPPTFSRPPPSQPLPPAPTSFYGPDVQASLSKEQKSAFEMGVRNHEYMEMARTHYRDRLSNFAHMTVAERDAQLKSVEQEMLGLFQTAMGPLFAQVIPDTIFGPQVFHQMGNMFTQFLAWQRLQQLVDVVPPELMPKRGGGQGVSQSVDQGPFSAPVIPLQTVFRPAASPAPATSLADSTSKKRARADSPQDLENDQPSKRPRAEEAPSAPAPSVEPEVKEEAKEEVVDGDKMEVDGSAPVNNDEEDQEIPDGEEQEEGGYDLVEDQPMPPSTPQRMQPDGEPHPTPETPVERTPSNFRLRPQMGPAVARISGNGIWGESFSHELREGRGFFIGRKNPNCQLDLSEYTDVRTISHKHCAILYNKALKRFEIENYGRNGTRLNNDLFGKNGNARRPLAHGDVIEIGKISIKFELLQAVEEKK